MAIMWDPPAERPSLEPTAAELAWKRWLMEALMSKNDDLPSPDNSTDEGASEVTPAA
jgi:hypothetical protein